MAFGGDFFRWKGASTVSSLPLIFLAFLVIRRTLAVVPIEQDALLKMKQSWKDPFDVLNDWIKGSNCSNWYGVKCDSSGYVVALYLSNSQLSGSIPSIISNLTNLKELTLSYNQLNGSIPSTIGNLTNLRILNLYSNKLSGSIPSTIRSLRNLRELTLSYNQLNGSIPSTIGNLTNLRELYLFSNKLSGSIPSTIGNLENLLYLSLPFNQLSGSIPSTIGNLTNLQYLMLYSNQLSGFIPSGIGSLKNLIKLNLESNYFVGIPKIQCGRFESCNLIANCLRGVPNQRTVSECALFCGANSPSGPCGGHGRCFFNRNKKASCTCDKGWALPRCQSKIKK